jgi:hypothetical protein
VTPADRNRVGRGGRPGPGPVRRLGASADTTRPRPGWSAYWATAAAELPAWAVEVALSLERPAEDRIQALALLRAPAKVQWLADIVAAVAEVEDAAGVGPVGTDMVTGDRAGTGSRLLPGPALPGLISVSPAVARAGLAVAGARGLAAPLRRWRPADGGGELSWQSSAGAVVTCHGPSGVSTQAVVALGGLGDVGGITPPPGGALVLRAWRADRRTWGVSFGLVLGAAVGLGLGREAARTAARARAVGWAAVVLRGATALHLARAGSPGQAPPVAAAVPASGAELTALFEACLAAGGLGRPTTGSRWALAVTP